MKNNNEHELVFKIKELKKTIGNSLTINISGQNRFLNRIMRYKEREEENRKTLKYSNYTTNLTLPAEAREKVYKKNSIRPLNCIYSTRTLERPHLIKTNLDNYENHKHLNTIHENDLKVTEDFTSYVRPKILASEKVYTGEKYSVKTGKCVSEFSYYEDMNKMFKDNMEDKGFSVINFRKQTNEAVFALFDGHGGDEVSIYLQKNFLKIYKSCLFDEDQITEALKQAFEEIDKDILKLGHERVGSTGLLVHLVKESPNKAFIYSANVGDTRCVLASPFYCHRISVDHRAEVEEEQNRIVNSGGCVFDNRVMGQLMLSRAFGDGQFKEIGVISDPFINKVKVDLRTGNQFLLLACDGVWDVLSDSDIKEIVKLHPFSTESICRDIIKTSLKKGAWDNLSVFAIQLS